MGETYNVWSTNKFTNELHTAVSVVYSVPSSVQSKNGEEGTLYATETTVCNSFVNLLVLQMLYVSPIITSAKHRLTLLMYCLPLK